MGKLKKKKYLALLGILLLVFIISGIFLLSKYDKFKGLISIKTADIKLLSDVSLTSSNIKGNEELTYQVRYTLDEIEGVNNRDVVIKAELTSNYARFKRIEDTNITSEVSNDGKNIILNISNVPLGEEQIINLKINVVNAPNGEEIKPVVDIKELTGEYTRLDTESVFVETNSIEGVVYDINELPVKNIELSISKDNEEIKRTYTTNDGTFIFTDLEEGNYKINVEEDIYEIVGDSTSLENNENLILRVKEVDKFNIETHKYINNLKLVIDGKENNYSYENVDKIVKSIKKFNDISGEIQYKIVVKNNSDKRTIVKNITDEIESGLSFDENKNPGWVKIDNKVKYLPIENVLLNPYEKREINITLDIINTKELKTYTNKVITKGDVKENVVFIVDGEEIRNITVTEGDKVEKPTLEKDVIWYTDRNKTNPYNFDYPVTKDLILYATLVETKYNVTFVDNNSVMLVEEVKENEKATRPTDPIKTGYTFKCWTLNDVCYNFDNNVESDITLVSSYIIDNYTITYNNITNEERETIDNKEKYTVETDTFTLNNPYARKDGDDLPYLDFLGWDDGDGNVSLNVTIEKGSTGNRTYSAVWKENEDDYTITYDLNDGEIDGINPNTYKRGTETFTLINPTKPGYTFSGWSGTGIIGTSTEVIISKGSAGNRNYVAHYTPINYEINYAGLTPEELISLGNPGNYTIESDSITLINPTREGYTFKGWSGTGIDDKLITVTIPTGSIGDKTYTANFEINKYKVTYMDGEDKFFEEEVNYNEKANGTSDIPIKVHNIFLGWYLNDSLFDFNTLITGDITLESKYEEVEAPTIDYLPKEWTNDKVSISISSDHDDYTYMYKVGDGNYTEYSGPFDLDENDTIYAYSVKNNIVSTEEALTISNLDKINPLINQMELDNITPVSARLNLKIKDEQSGLDKYKVYVDNSLVFESPSYTTGVTEEKTEEYSLSNLDELTTYVITLEVFDVSGNVTTSDLSLETPPKHYVARVLNYEREEIEKYESLEEAIESDNCLTTCYIEMLDDIDESNDILTGQDITIDLNGKTITGVDNYTFKNNGNLKVVDNSIESIGKIKSNDIPIINKGVFQLGENEEELFVNTERPIIEGNTNGIQNTGTLKFYDGSIIGTLPVDGMVNDTPFLYNAKMTEVGSKQIATLTRVADAVARLNSVYYTDAQLAIDKSSKGYEEEVDFTRSLIKQLKSDDQYRFVYDEETDSVINDNRYVNSTLAHSYIKLDLTNYTDNQMLYVNAEITTGYGDYGYVTVTESINTPEYNDTNGRFIYLNNTVAAKDYSTILKKGKVYYLHIGFKKDGSNYNNADKIDTFRINKISLGNFDQVEFSSLDNIIMYNDSSYYSFQKQNDDSYVSTNEGIPNSYSHSYFVVDLTNINESRYLYLNAKVSSQANYDYGYVTVNNSYNLPSPSASGRQIYISGEQAEKQYVIELQPNQINFVHLVYYKYNNSIHYGEDKFTITSIKPLRSDTDEVTDGELVNNGDYYFEKLKVVPDLTSNNYAIPVGVTKTETNEFNFNGNNSGLKMEQVITTSPLSEESLVLTINPRNTSNQLIYMGSSNEKTAFGVYNNYLIVSVGSSNKTNTYPIPAGFTDGTDKKIVITCNSNNEYSLYYNDVLQENQSTLDAWQQGVNSYTYIGTRAGNYPYPYNGIISNVKTYNRVLSEEEILGTPSDEGLILHIDGSADLVERDAYVNNNPGIYPTTASSYMLFDLTNKTSDMTLRANVTINSRSYNYGYITVKETPTVPTYNDTAGRYYLANNSYSTSIVDIKLEAGKLNYVHFCFADNQPKSTSYNEQLTINSLKLLRDDLESDMYDTDYITHNSVNFSNSKIIPVLNEEPETVELVKNITLSKPLEIVNTRDVVLDLNGKTLTTSSDDYVIKNEGSLKIIDSDYDERLDINERYKEEQAALFRDAIERYTSDKDEYEEYAGLCDGCEPSEEYKLDQTMKKDFEYTGTEQVFNASISANYKVELWGAQGGGQGKDLGGKGAYTSGILQLNEGDKLYVYVGNYGYMPDNLEKPFNGGGKPDIIGSWSDSHTGKYSGGGATDVRFFSTTPVSEDLEWDSTKGLNSRIMVAAGGAGGNDGNGSPGGVGGTLVGGSTRNRGSGNYVQAPTQISGYAFGIGQGSGRYSSDLGADTGAGGGGYYGGYRGLSTDCGGSGGTSYVSGYEGCVAITSEVDTTPKQGCSETPSLECSYHYSNKIFTDSVMLAGDEEMPSHDGTSTITGNEGNGYAKITCLLTPEQETEIRSHLPKTYNVKEEPIFKNYIKTIDFDDSIDIDSLDVNSNPEYKNKVSDTVLGTVTSSNYSVILNDYDAYLNVYSGNVVVDKTGRYAGIDNKGKLTLGEDAYIKTMQTNNRGIYNNQSGDILDGSGNITTSTGTSYGILNDSVVDKNIKGYKINSLVDSSYNIYNRSYNDLVLDGMTTSGKGIDIYQDTDSNLTVKNSTLGSTGNESFYSNESNIPSEITFDKCNILNRIYNRDKSYRKISINNSNMTSGSKINNIYNVVGEVSLNNTDIFNTANYTDSNIYSIYNSGKLDIIGGSLTKNNHSSKTYYGVYNTSDGDVSVNGNFEITDNYNYGIYNLGTLTLGDNKNPVSDEKSLIQGSTSAIYGSSGSTFNYYDGKLIGPINQALNGIVTDVPDNYDLNVSQNDNKDIITLKSTSSASTEDDYVAAIGNNKFASIQAAIDSVSESTEPTEIILLKDISTARNNIIPTNKNIILNQNGYSIRSYNDVSAFTNNGTFSITDTNTPKTNVVFKYFIINNGILNYDVVKTTANSTNNLIKNNEEATLNINGGELYCYESGLIENAGTLTINAGKLYTTRTWSSTFSSYNLITNSSTGQVNITGGEIVYLGDGSVIDNSGRVEVSNVKVDLLGNAWYSTHFIKNITSSSYAKITGGTYGEKNKKGILIKNAGTADIINVTSNLYVVANNTGTVTVTGGVFNTSLGSAGSNVGSGGMTSSSGTLTLEGVTIKDSSSAPVISAKGTTTVNVEDSEITNTMTGNANDYSKGIALEETATLNIINSTIKSNTSNGLNIKGTATANIFSGSIISSKKTSLYVDGSPILNIGTQGGTVSTENPTISGINYGLYNNSSTSSINFYDGKISGQTAIHGVIATMEDGYDIVLDTVDGVEYKYLGMLPVIKNKNTGSEHYTIQDAIDNARDNDTLELMREYTTTPSLETIVNNKILTLDLKGYKIQQNNQALIQNDGTLTVKTSETGGMIEGYSSNSFVNNGTLTIENGKYHQATINDIIINNEGATLNINGGEFYSYKRRVIENNGIMNMTSGKISGSMEDSLVSNNYSLIENGATGVISLVSGEFNYYGRGAVIRNSGSIEVTYAKADLSGCAWGSTAFINNITNGSYAKITGGTYGETNKKGILIKNAGTADIINVTSNLYVVANNTGTLNITGGTYNASGGSSSESSSGTIISTSGTLTLDSVTVKDSSSVPVISARGTTTVNVENSEITNTMTGNANDSCKGIALEETATLNITNSTIKSNTSNGLNIKGTATANIFSGSIISSKKISLYVDGSPILNIGTKGGTVSTENPSISGINYGLYNNSSTSSINFYDGKISGQTAVFGKIATLELGYDIILETVDGVEYKYLGMLPVIKNKNTGSEHYTIQDAIDNARDNDTLELIREYTTNSSLATAVNDKTLTLDLKGHKIQQNNQVLIQNDGTLTVKTSETGGMIEGYSSSLFVNNGTLTIEDGKYHQTTVNDLITNNDGATLNINGGEFYSYKRRVIENNGIMKMTSGKISGSMEDSLVSNNYSLIENGATGVISLVSGEFNYYGRGAVIRNSGSIEVTYAKADLSGCAWGSTAFINNITNGSYAKITGGTYGETNKKGILIKNAGTADIINVTSNLYVVANNTGTLNITGGTYNASGGSSSESNSGTIVSSSGTLTLDGITINESSSIPAVYVSNTSNLNINGDVNATGPKSAIDLAGTGTANVTSGTVTSSSTYAIYIEGASTLNVGTLGGGIPSTDNPVIYGKTYGIYKNNNSANIYFYDGVIKGETGPISGSITDYEPGYKEERNSVTDPNTGVTTTNATLTIIGDDIRKVVVNNINFTSLQSAVNYAVSNSITRIDLYNDVEIESDIIKPEGINVNVYLNGYHIIGDYTIGSGINIIDSNDDPNNLGASVLGNNKNTKNIVIYQLDDGSDLKTNIIYRLYKLSDGNYESINVNENKVGSYDIGKDTDELYTVNSRIYINNISEGTYKLSESDGNEINFEISADGVSSNIRINNMVIKNRVVEAIAILILQLQTGVFRIPYILIILITIIIILSIIAIKKHKRI